MDGFTACRALARAPTEAAWKDQNHFFKSIPAYSDATCAE